MYHKKLDSFPLDFLWGAASSAYQIEGAYQADGKGLSIWDQFVEIPGTTFENTNGKVAMDHYHRMEEDVTLMHEAGLKAYRFSIAWSRILPNGSGAVNPQGIAFYQRLITLLKQYQIEPIVTLYHWDLPLALQERYGGWESRQIIKDFHDYCQVLFDHFGFQVKYWVTLNEQNMFIEQGYILGIHPPGVQDVKRSYQANHHAFVANALVIKTYHDQGYPGMIGPSFAFSPNYSASCNPKDVLAMDNQNQQQYWYTDMYLWGQYPPLMSKYLQANGCYPTIEPDDFEILKAGKPDFLGINYYRSLTFADNPLDGLDAKFVKYNTTGVKGTSPAVGIAGFSRQVDNPYVEKTNWDWEIDPQGLRIGMRQLYARYGKPILISENGLGEYDTIIDQQIDDQSRIEYLRMHLLAIREAITDGVPVLGYTMWSFTDLLSWLNGYQKRYGLVYIDRDEKSQRSLNRMKKATRRDYGNSSRRNNGPPPSCATTTIGRCA